MTVLAAAPGHAIILRVGAQTLRIRDTFELSLRIEERFGRLFQLVTRKRSDWPLAEMAELYRIVIGGHDVADAELHAHISQIGLMKAWDEIDRIFAVIINGWDALSEEAEAGAAANPPRRKPGPKPGSKRQPKDSPGETSSAPPASSASSLPASGASHPSSSPLFGAPPPAAGDLLGGMAPEAPNGVLQQAPNT